MSVLDAILIVAVLGFFAWLVLGQRSRRDADSKLRSTVLQGPDGGIVFDGSQAVVLLRDYLAIGGDSGPQLSAKYLCKMPEGAAYWVFIDIEGQDAPDEVTISELTPAEVDDVLATYPYLKQLTSQLKRGA